MYGFRSCDMVRNAMKWLDARNITYEFVDYRKNALDPALLDDWFARAGWEAVFNRNSTAYKLLPEESKAGVDARRAKQLILEESNLIKRPVLDTGSSLLFGFRDDAWSKALGI